MTEEIRKQLDKVVDELYALHDLLPKDEQKFYIQCGEFNLPALAQIIEVNLEISETIKEVLASEQDS